MNPPNDATWFIAGGLTAVLVIAAWDQYKTRRDYRRSRCAVENCERTNRGDLGEFCMFHTPMDFDFDEYSDEGLNLD